MAPSVLRLVWASALLVGCFVDSISAQGAGGSGASTPAGGGGQGGGGGATPTGGSPPEGGQAQGGNGSGGGDCGNGIVEPGEDCEDDDPADPLDGCVEGCRFGPLDGCDSTSVAQLDRGKTITIAGSTAGAADDMTLNGDFAGLACDSDGADIFYVVRVVEAGAVRVALEVGPDGSWGGSMEKGVLQIRSGCDAADAGEVLLCAETTEVPGSDPPVGLLEARLFPGAGQLLAIGVDGRGNGEMGDYTLTIEHFECGDGVVQPPEQCDQATDCQGCLIDDPLNRCGPDDFDTLSFMSADDHCYVLEASTDLNFFEARERCIEMGGDLTTLSPAAEKDAFDGLFFLGELAWVGLQDFAQDGTYTWLAGPDYSGPWEPSNPDNGESKPRCAALEEDSALFASWALDFACDDTLPAFMCELRGANP
ncbi:MAG: C-type lectin domain-containing protein [Polyangiaceae bacterium]|nr:C-type lectin domain-containing protein [Polyangiaceae bacterium]